MLNPPHHSSSNSNGFEPLEPRLYLSDTPAASPIVEVGSPIAGSSVSEALLGVLAADRSSGDAGGAWNTKDPTDVNSDGATTPLDALLLINEANLNGMGPMGSRPSNLDVTKDGTFNASDVLQVINTCNAETQSEPEKAVGSYDFWGSQQGPLPGRDIPAGDIASTLSFALVHGTQPIGFVELRIHGDWTAVKSVSQFDKRIPVTGPTVVVPRDMPSPIAYFDYMIQTRPDAAGKEFSVEAVNARNPEGKLIELDRLPMWESDPPWLAGPYKVTANPKSPVDVTCDRAGSCEVTTNRPISITIVDAEITGTAGQVCLVLNGLALPGTGGEVSPGTVEWSNDSDRSVTIPAGKSSLKMIAPGATDVVPTSMFFDEVGGDGDGIYSGYNLTVATDSEPHAN
ncbi:MAG: dockerin type I domain-containing protein [Candidatus Peribacteraceae bacterium]|nr:dockerin type I domain-containing protein [Candidatus Peribacteraceae bacterium]